MNSTKQGRGTTRRPSQRPTQGGKPAPKKKGQRTRRRRGSYLLYYVLIVLTAIALGIGLSLTVFFRVESVVVEGNTRYQEQAIIDTAAIGGDENLFRMETDLIAQRVERSYPYAEQVIVKRRLPSTAVISITEAEPLGYFLQEDGSYVLVSRAGRVLQVGTGEPTEEYMQISGVEVTGVAPCQTLPKELGESMTMFRYLHEAVENTGFHDITSINLSDRLNIRLVYQDRLLIELGSEGDLADKLDFALYAIQNEIPQNFEGVLDVTIARQARYRPQEIHDDPNRHPPVALPTPEEEEEETAQGEASSNPQEPVPEVSGSQSAPAPQSPAQTPPEDPSEDELEHTGQGNASQDEDTVPGEEG